MPRLILFLGLLFSVTLTALPVHAAQGSAAELVQRADQLLKNGRPEEAYRLLAPLEAQLAGKYQYDYLLGIAALQSNRPTQATFALERVLSVKPNFAGARMDLARAYFGLGDYARAQKEFERVLAANPPKVAREVAERYLEAIAQKDESGETTRLSGYAQFGAGYDSNVNNATDQTTIFVPLFGIDFGVAATNQETDDTYLSAGGGVAISHRIREGTRLFGNLDGRSRRLADTPAFDQDNLDFKAGVALGEGADVVNVAAHGGRLWVDRNVNRDNYGTEVSWQHLYSPTSALTFFGRYSRLRHQQETLRVNDIDQTLMGGSWFKAFSRGGTDIVTASAYGGRETAREGRPDGGKSIWGVSLGGQRALTPGIALYGNLGFQQGDYDERNVAFQAERRDELTTAKLGLSWAVGDDWSLRAEVTRYQNDSNIAINEYNRTDALLTMRRDFR